MFRGLIFKIYKENKIKNTSLRTLSNGLRVAIFNYPHLVSTQMILMFKAGPIFEDPEHNGISHFTEHMLLKSTKKYDSKEKVRDAVKEIGGLRDGLTTRDRVWYYFQCLNQYIGEGLDILSQSTLHPLLTEQDFKEERDVVLTEVKKAKDNIDKEIINLVDNAVFEGSMSMRNCGDEKAVLKIKHNQILSHYEEFYSPKNSILAVTTALAPEKILEDVEKYFSKWSSRGMEKEPNNQILKKKERTVFWEKEAQSVHLAIGFETVKRGSQKEKNALDVLRFILRERLFEELRLKRSLIYSVRVWNMTYYENKGLFFIKTEFDKNNLIDGIKEIIKAIKGLNEITDKELEIAKNNVASLSIFGYEKPGNFSISSTYSLLYTGQPIDPETERKSIFRVTKNDLSLAVKKFFNIKDMSFVLAGKIEPSMKKYLEDQIK